MRRPERINVSVSYGITVLNGAPDAARGFVEFVSSSQGQAMLARHAFAPR